MGDNSTTTMFPEAEQATGIGDVITTVVSDVITTVIENVTSNVTDALSNVTTSVTDSYDYEPIAMTYSAWLTKGLWKYVPPVLLIIGTIGNGLSAVVMLRKELGHGSTTSLYLAVLAFVDLAILYTGLLRMWILKVWGIDLRAQSHGSCLAHSFFTYALMQYQAWIIVNVTMERLVAVFVPHRAGLIFTRKLVIISLLVTALIVAGINAHFFWTVELTEYHYSYEDYDGDGEIDPLPDPFIYCNASHFVRKIWPWIDLAIFSLVPSIILIVSNVAIILKMARASRAHGRTASAQAKITTMTIVLLTVSVVFLLTTTPVSVYLIVNHFFGPDPGNAEHERQLLGWVFVNLIMYVNNSVNFFLYCISGTRFRREVAALLCGCIRRRGGDSRSTNATQSMSLSTVAA